MKCPECSKQISDKAEVCPSCGYPIKKQTPEGKFQKWREKRLKYLVILCLACLPVGIALKEPVVLILASIGVVAGCIKLSSIKTKRMNRNS